jgi:hypothetical protein
MNIPGFKVVKDNNNQKYFYGKIIATYSSLGISPRTLNVVEN